MRILHIDIETFAHTVLSWGLYNQNIALNQILSPGYTLCFAAKWHNEKKIIFKSVYHNTEEEMVKTAWNLLHEADAVVTWNGRKFDLPTLNKDFLLYNLGPPSPYKDIDLLPVARRKFRLASNKLDFVAQQLGIGKKLPHKGMDLWRECEQGDKKAWKTMKEYNIQDVALLENVYLRLVPWIDAHPNHALYLDNIRPVCKNCGSENVQSRGTEKTKTMIYHRWHCQECGTWQRNKTNITPKEKEILI
jgi:predicted PolB exonuclease-like 3'-5' exonuclease